ncbi:3-oxoadipate enol-lactonase [Tritonibacter horizontis]|uniref:3-oxoadipate enol-lactonase 2 n=1 Tax=Tritonibacter horizontis TaxID=1768241 RepID=A0A132BXI6_9RHOB|nr:3-oxoadipate enol-lactonase [Tritonibacter horizontis]KUP92906.1 3-oxoadipate enol-lactonase 2 [Tritonibacter horizontis]
MRMAKLKHTALHWREDGAADGPVVVFANSLGTDLRLWDAVVDRLPKHLRLIRFDKRGHGLSACPPGPYSIDDLAADTLELLDHAAVAQCTFVGLSIGGMIAQALAAQAPERITALVLSNTAARMGDPAMWQQRIDAINAGGIQALSDAVMERWFAPGFLASQAHLPWRHMLERTPRAGYIGCCQALAGADLTATTQQLSQPTLGIAGSLDGASPPALVEATIDLIADSRFTLIEDTGHLPCVEAPDAFAGALTDFLKELGHV